MRSVLDQLDVTRSAMAWYGGVGNKVSPLQLCIGLFLCYICLASEPGRISSASNMMSYHEQFLDRTARVRQQDPAFECEWRKGACMFLNTRPNTPNTRTHTHTHTHTQNKWNVDRNSILRKNSYCTTSSTECYCVWTNFDYTTQRSGLCVCVCVCVGVRVIVCVSIIRVVHCPLCFPIRLHAKKTKNEQKTKAELRYKQNYKTK